MVTGRMRAGFFRVLSISAGTTSLTVPLKPFSEKRNEYESVSSVPYPARVPSGSRGSREYSTFPSSVAIVNPVSSCKLSKSVKSPDRRASCTSFAIIRIAMNVAWGAGIPAADCVRSCTPIVNGGITSMPKTMTMNFLLNPTFTPPLRRRPD